MTDDTVKSEHNIELALSTIRTMRCTPLEAAEARLIVKAMATQLSTLRAERDFLHQLKVEYEKWIQGQYSGQLCCGGHDCGCQGMTQGDEIVYTTRLIARAALSPKD